MSQRFEPIATAEVFPADDAARDIFQGDLIYEIYDSVRGRVYETGLNDEEAHARAGELNAIWSPMRRERSAFAHNARLHAGSC